MAASPGGGNVKEMAMRRTLCVAAVLVSQALIGAAVPAQTLDGPYAHVDVVNADSTDVYRMTFRGGEAAVLRVIGDGSTRLDLYIYDENGNLITSAVGPGDVCRADFHPLWTGPFVIKIVNRGYVWNRYTLLTN
jgi:hypothetical protein